jgi:crotonobetainyl-CoA:carnitine CoA-transferase CaiB-like acyl-CoA transferase
MLGVADYLIESQAGSPDDPGSATAGIDAPRVQECLRCRDDRWVCVDVTSDAQFMQLSTMLQTTAGTDPGTLTSALRAFARDRDAAAVEYELTDRGIPAGVSQTLWDVTHDEHLRDRGFFPSIPRPGGKTQPIAATPWLTNGQRLAVGAPPQLGADTYDIARRVAALSDAQFERYLRDGAFGSYVPERTDRDENSARSE